MEQMTVGQVVAIISALLSLLCVVASAVWIVGKMRTASEINAMNARRLADTLDRVSLRLDHIDERVHDHEGRLVRVETLQARSSSPGDRAAGSS